ncbi:MAG: GNAT family N-acetyltransferase [Dehalococcoidia bacterium]|nr:GNAT family N-acetyltransferase [Dehalococcoidia bacterium]
MTNFRIRPARPQDASFLAWVMLTAGRSHLQRGIWDIIIARPEHECLTFLKHLSVTDEPHMCHYSVFLVAETDGRPAAALSAYDPVNLGEETVALGMPAVMQKMGLTEEDMASGQQGLQAFMTCHIDPYDGAWIVESVAALPGFRRQGAISLLLGEILEEGRRRGFRLAQVGSYIDNIPAQRAYGKAGFKLLDEKRHPDFEREIGCPGMARFLRDL